MTFRVVHKPSANHVHCPYRIVEQATGREIDWNRPCTSDYEMLRRLADANPCEHMPTSCLHFLRGGGRVFNHTDVVAKDALTESTLLLDYVRFQSGQERELTGPDHQSASCHRRSFALRIIFPDAPHQAAPALQTNYWQRATPMGIGKPRPALSRLPRQDSQANHRALVGGRGGAILVQLSELPGTWPSWD